MMERWIADELMRMQIARPASLSVIAGLTDFRTLREIMDELREVDPEAAMLLGEYIVLGDTDE